MHEVYDATLHSDCGTVRLEIETLWYFGPLPFGKTKAREGESCNYSRTKQVLCMYVQVQE